MQKKPTIFVDADAFIALAKEDDHNHERAVRLFQRLAQQHPTFLTSNYVFAEVVTVISQRHSHQAAVDFIERLRSPRSFVTIQWITEEIEELAIHHFKGQTSKNVSFVDCTNMALLDFYRFDCILSFDIVYKKNNYSLAQDLVEQAV